MKVHKLRTPFSAEMTACGTWAHGDMQWRLTWEPDIDCGLCLRVKKKQDRERVERIEGMRTEYLDAAWDQLSIEMEMSDGQ